jgi:hypothetical protein
MKKLHVYFLKLIFIRLKHLKRVFSVGAVEVFQVKPFVSRLLGGMGDDTSKFIDTFHEVDFPLDQHPELLCPPWVSEENLNTETLHPRELFPPSMI